MEVNEKCDVYSFGVIALEVIMGKHLGDLISSSSSSTSTTQGIFLKDVLDQHLAPRNQVAEQVVVANICMFTHHSNISANHATSCYNAIKAKPTPRNQFYMITLGQLFDINCSSS
ncbi:putative leucine-rich repeat receptor-like protein kinase [Camellia lanceoleosa]|uniref:Leucine-rich repeat receptor-like protein kinase n=1 Tax=Camellia lanceoleosa TaxID=1840588 RepID=A0ACC0IC56_9ERIC|nr:putative leucine-rich repeat receptor-like protein kinase [Camellia lanceoleosa]